MLNRRVFLLTGLGLAVVPEAQAQSRPRVLIFPTSLGRLAVASEEKPGSDGLTDADRINMAARAVREQLEAENVVTTLLYDGKDTYFQKAMAAAKVKLSAGSEPDEATRLKIGAEVGAYYIMTVFSRLSVEQGLQGPPKDAPKPSRKQGEKTIEQIYLPATNTIPLPPSLELEAIEVKPGGKAGQRWQDRIAVSSAMASGRRAPGAIPAGMETAARTLVYRFLGGPLHDLTRTSLDPSLLPPPQKPKPVVPEAPPLDYDAEAARLIQDAQEQLRRDQHLAAIALLRQAVNFQPREAAPRLLLAEAYQRAHRPGEAANEVQRALKLATAATPAQRAELLRLLARSLVDSGDQDGATQLFNQLLADNPANTEARLGLADLLLSRGQNEAAEIQFRLIRDRAPGSIEAGQGLARLLMARGSLDDAIKETKASVPLVQHAMATLIFVQTATGIAARTVQNRTAWEENKLNREIFYKATLSQSERAKQLADMLGLAAPPESVSEPIRLAHNRRVLAANLLSQAISSLQGFLETGEAATGVRARTLLNEFYTEMKDADGPGK